MIIRTLTVFERDAVRNFYLALSSDDRRKRFCCTLSDETISKYVDGLDFTRHTILGAFDEHAQLIGLAELALGAEQSEMAFSVRQDMRCQWIGTKLMESLLLRARICGVRKVLVMFLSENSPMRRMAKRAGMLVETDDGEAYASRELLAPNAEELARWFIDEAIAHSRYFSILGIESWGTGHEPRVGYREYEQDSQSRWVKIGLSPTDCRKVDSQNSSSRLHCNATH